MTKWRPMYFDRQGNPIADPLEWGRLHTPEYKRVAETTIGDAWVSTVWVGIDMGLSSFYDGPPLIFETMVFVNPEPDHPVHPEIEALDHDCWRYVTEAEAIAGHDAVCVEIRVLLAQIRMADEIVTEAIERAEGQ